MKGPRVVFAVVSLLALAACEKKPEGPAPSESFAPRVKPPPPPPPGTGAAAIDGVLPDIHIRDREATTVRISWQTPPGTALNDEAPFRVRWDSSEGLAEAPPEMKATGSAVKDGLSLKVRPLVVSAKARLEGELSLVVCDAKDHSICLPVKRHLRFQFVPDKAAQAETVVALALPAAK